MGLVQRRRWFSSRGVVLGREGAWAKSAAFRGSSGLHGVHRASLGCQPANSGPHSFRGEVGGLQLQVHKVDAALGPQ